MENLKSIYAEISSANLEYRSAVGRNTGIAAAKDRVKNLLFNHRDLMLAMMYDGTKKQTEIDSLKERLEATELELEEVDNENKELRQKLRQMEERPRGKNKTMTAVVE